MVNCFQGRSVPLRHGSVALLLTVFQYGGFAMKGPTVLTIPTVIRSSAVRESFLLSGFVYFQFLWLIITSQYASRNLMCSDKFKKQMFCA